MQIVASGQKFSFNYTAYDQNAGLFIAFTVYDVTTGTAVFLQKITSAYSNFGAYMADYTPSGLASYLVIGIVYTDNTYTTVDNTRSPSAQIFQVAQTSSIYFPFAYASYDLDTILNLRASIYRMTSGTPVLLGTASMVEVAFGVYFGSYTGVIGNTYQAISVVYTDNTFTTPDPDRAAGCDGFDSIHLVPNIVVSGTATLRGQTNQATLIGQANGF